MGTAATVTSKGMATIPVALRRKYHIEDGDKVEFVDIGDGIMLIPIKKLSDSFGIDGSIGLEIAKGIETDRKKEIKHDREEA